MQIYKVESGNFKLDGGAMFGVVPKTLWSKKVPADENNMCSWSMRLMLVEDGNRLVLFDTGMGDKQSEKFFSFFHPHGDDSLDGSLKKLGFSPADITDVVLTHLHFDHCGGAVDRVGEKLKVHFPNAEYWSNEKHWDWAVHPNEREKASFLRENILPIEESGQLKHVPREGDYTREFLPGIDALFVDGHTESQMIPHLKYKGKTIVYAADLLPSTAHIPLPWVMGFDVRPLVTVDEKAKFLERAADEEHVIFLEHDKQHECCTVQHTEKGVRLKETFSWNEAFGG